MIRQDLPADALQDLAPHQVRALRQAVAVLHEFYDPQAIFLFGSVAKGTGTDSSDIDLLMRVSRSGKARRGRGSAFKEAMAETHPRCDLSVFTDEEVAHYMTDPHSFLASVMVSARPLFLRDPAREPLLVRRRELSGPV